MKTFQLLYNGKRIARLTVNCRASSKQISESCFVAAIAFSLANKYEELEETEYCGMADYERMSKSGAHVQIYVVEEGGVDD